MTEVRDKVRFAETDMMGVVHHANYFRWFENGRVEALRAAGIDLNEWMAQGILFPISDVNCKYLVSARFDDRIRVETTLTEVSRAKMVFTYRVIRENDGVLLATGRTQNVFTDAAGRVVRLPPPVFAKLSSGAVSGGTDD